MAAVAIRDVLEYERSVACGGVRFPILHGGFNSEDVHAVDFEAWDVLTALVVFSECGGTVGGGAHAVFVVCQGKWVNVSASVIRSCRRELGKRGGVYFRSRRGWADSRV